MVKALEEEKAKPEKVKTKPAEEKPAENKGEKKIIEKERAEKIHENKVTKEVEDFVLLYADKLKTNPNEAFFWSGRTDGIGGKEIALEIAISKKGTTLEALVDKFKIPMPEWDMKVPSSIKTWQKISESYAKQTSGEVRIIMGESVRSDSVWNQYEFPALKSNTKVIKITKIDPKTKKETIIFIR